jgi:hypothetical protein
VAQKINSQGYKTKVRNTEKSSTRGGGNYTKTAIAQILRNPLYIGKKD